MYPSTKWWILFSSLREDNAPFDQVVWPDEVHVFLLYRHFIEGYKATAAFFQKHLGPAETARAPH